MMQRRFGELVCREAAVAEILELRRRILRPGMPTSRARFERDEAADTLHVGAFDAAGRCVGCVSALRSTWEGEPAYQLRGMATAPKWRGRGVGAAMMRLVQQWVSERTDVRLMWCNARVKARGFYEKQGWEAASDVFDVPTAGPHYRMWFGW